NAAMVLHGHAHGVGDVLRFLARGARLDLVDAVKRIVDAGFGYGLMRMLALGMRLDDMMTSRTAEHDKVEQGIGTQTVGAVNRSSCAFADGVQTIDCRGFAIGNADHLTIYIGGYAAHLVVYGWHNRNRILDGIDVGELDGNFTN